MVDIEQVSDRDRWNEHVEGSTDATPFHRFEALEVIARQTGTELLPLVGYKGQEQTGLCPMFVKEIAGLSLVYSPPPNTDINYLGPVLLNIGSLRQRKRSSRNRRFVDAVLEYVKRARSTRYAEREVGVPFFSIKTAPDYDDVRPFLWNDFSARTLYTFEVDLRPDTEEILQSFSSDARRSVQSVHDEAVEFREGDVADLRRTLAQAEQVYREQGLSYPGTPSLVVDLFQRLGDDVCRTYVCTIDGEFAGGTMTVETDRAIYLWHGGADRSRHLPVYELMDWHIMTDARERGVEWCDLMGADNRSISDYKAKFDPRLRNHYVLERSNPVFATASKWYQAAKNRPSLAQVLGAFSGR